MSDNLIELKSLESRTILFSVIEKTKRCSLIWDKKSNNLFSTVFDWNGNQYVVKLNIVQRTVVVDFYKNDRMMFSLNSNVYNDVNLLSETVNSSFNENAVKQILQDLNSLDPCTHQVVSMMSAEKDYNLILDVPKENAFILAFDASNRNLEIIYSNWERSVFLKNTEKTIRGICFDEQIVFWAIGSSIQCLNLKSNEILDISFDGEVLDIVLDKKSKSICLLCKTNTGYCVQKCGYNGSNKLVVSNIQGTLLPLSITIFNDVVYWCDSLLNEGYVYSSNLDGTDFKPILSTVGMVKCVHCCNEKLYIGGSGLFAYTDLDGKNEVLLNSKGLSIIEDMDSNKDNLYLSDVGVGKIFKCDFYASSLEQTNNDYIKRSRICLVN